MPKVPLKVAVPATAGALSWLNAKYHLSHDLTILWRVLLLELGQKRRDKSGQHNIFYRFEENALNPAVADTPCLIFEGREWTYRVAYETILRYGQWLKTKFDVKPGEVVALDSMNKPNFIFIWFGLWSIGAKVAFINYNLTDRPLLHSVKMATARLILVDKEVQSALSESVMAEFASSDFRDGEITESNRGPTQVYVFSDDLEQEIWRSYSPIRDPDSVREATGHDMCLLIYTSGTTGLPKPSYIHWNKVNRVCVTCVKLLEMKKEDRFYTSMPLYHSAGSVLAALNTFWMGIPLVLGRKFSIRNFWPEVRASRATIIQYVGETCRYLLSAAPSPLDSQNDVRLAFGNGLRPDIWNTFKNRFDIAEIMEFYGATESPVATFNSSRNDLHLGAVGRTGKLLRLLFGGRSAIVAFDFETDEPIRDPETGFCKRIDPNNPPAGASDPPPGELIYRLVDDPAELIEQFAGYYGNEKATNAKIMRNVFETGDTWFRTGDLMRNDTDGHIFFHDRIGDTFRWKSENVSTNEVADAIGALQLDAVEEANVYGVELPNHDGRAGCAALALKEADQAPSQQTIDHVLNAMAQKLPQMLPRYAVPLFVRILTAVERTGTNKQQKSVLRAEGVQPKKIEERGDSMYWLQQHGTGFRYVPYADKGYSQLQSGEAKF